MRSMLKPLAVAAAIIGSALALTGCSTGYSSDELDRATEVVRQLPVEDLFGPASWEYRAADGTWQEFDTCTVEDGPLSPVVCRSEGVRKAFSYSKVKETIMNPTFISGEIRQDMGCRYDYSGMGGYVCVVR